METRSWPQAAIFEADDPVCLLPPSSVPPSLKQFLKDSVGFVTPSSRWLAAAPWTARAHAMMVRKPIQHLPPYLPGFGNLIVAQDNSCRFCFTGQRSILRVMGFSGTQIDQLERDFHAANLNAKDVLGLEFIRKVARCNPRPGPADVEELMRAGYARNAIMELCFIAAAGTFTNRLSTLLALPPEYNQVLYTGYPFFSLFRPLILKLWKATLRPIAEAARQEDADLPGAALLEAFGDLPAAAVVRRTIREAFASAIVPRRTKLLILAIVSKALGCSHGQTHAQRALCGEGLRSEEIDEVLAKLTSGSLDARERKLVPFARETVRYEHRTIQRRTAEVTAGLSPAEICEVVGMVALANALCRLSVILECSSLRS